MAFQWINSNIKLRFADICIFRDDLASDFGMSRPPISVSSGH